MPHAKESEGSLEGMARILDRPPITMSDGLRGDTLLTGRWQHGPVHDTLAALPAHVIVAHHGGDGDMSLRASGGVNIRARSRQGTMVIIPKGQDGRWDIAGNSDVSHVYLTHERLTSTVEEMTRGRDFELVNRVAFEDATIVNLITMLSNEAMAAETSSRLFVEQAIDLLCTQIVRGHSSFGTLPDPAAKRGGLADWQVKRVTTYMRSKMEEEIGLDELAGLVHLSRFHFCTAFKKATGRNPHETLTMIRIARAKEMLADPDLPVTEIGLCVGYQTPSSFAASFRKMVGMSPSEFRRRL
jgi:AraC family transcriptional regulator